MYTTLKEKMTQNRSLHITVLSAGCRGHKEVQIMKRPLKIPNVGHEVNLQVLLHIQVSILGFPAAEIFLISNICKGHQLKNKTHGVGKQLKGLECVPFMSKTLSSILSTREPLTPLTEALAILDCCYSSLNSFNHQ